MNTTNNLETLLNDLAALWTEPILQTLKTAGFRQVSVGLELEVWRTLKRLLQTEAQWQQASPLSALVSPQAFSEQVFRRAAVLAAEKFEPRAVTAEFKSRLRESASARRSTVAERRLYKEVFRQPRILAALKPPSRTDFMPRFRVAALGGNSGAVASL